jgi:hypothetical protein
LLFRSNFFGRYTMPSENVRVLTGIKPPTFVTIPVAELAPGMVAIRIEGEEGVIYADPKLLQTAEAPRWGPFPESVKDAIRRFAVVFRSVYDKTPEQWEEGFRMDGHP